MAVGANGLDEAKCVEDHEELVKTIARKYATGAVGLKDLEQEAFIGLLMSVRKWSPELGSFRMFARCLITKAVRRAVGQSNSGKLKKRSEVIVSLDSSGDDEEPEGTCMHETLPSGTDNPEELFSMAEERARLQSVIRTLSAAEQEVINLHLSDLSQKEMSQLIGRSRQACTDIWSKATHTLAKKMAS